MGWSIWHLLGGPQIAFWGLFGVTPPYSGFGGFWPILSASSLTFWHLFGVGEKAKLSFLVVLGRFLEVCFGGLIACFGGMAPDCVFWCISVWCSIAVLVVS